ncbi:MAG: Na/Pi cotransporter family protein [Sedimentisphaerales bacterium]|nr:Na/Pi cotransporter family protein [Sedimentisphaerales bacterium]
MGIDWKELIFFVTGGLGLFLIGMGMMSEGLKEVAGRKLKQVLESMTKQPLVGFAMGTLITGLIQSSSATTVMIIGLINAGLLTLRQAICVIFGANVGTTVTAWIVSLTQFEGFNITDYALPAIMIGFLLQVLGKKRKTKSVGKIIIGFSVLFIGLGFMKDAFGGLEENPQIVQWLAGMGGKPHIALLAGMLITMLIQSSSAAIAIFQMMAVGGALGEDWMNVLNLAIPFMLGSDIGTTITAQIAALQTNVPAKRAAWAHTMFNVIGVALALPFFYAGLFTKAVLAISWWQLGPGTILSTIAVANTLFKLSCSGLFLPFTRQLEALVNRIVRQKKGEILAQPVVLEARLLDTPAIALEQSKREIVRMAREGKRALETAIEALMASDRKGVESTRKIEDLVDAYQFQITTYLVDLSKRQLDEEVSRELPVLLHMVNDLERVGDHAVNIAEIADRKIDQGVVFTDVASEESKGAVDEIYLMFDNVILALDKNDIQAAHRALTSENKLNRMQVQFRRHHVQRMTDGVCGAESGIIFIDVVDNIEKIGDHLTNIAQSVIGGIQWAGVKGNMLSGEFNALSDAG